MILINIAILLLPTTLLAAIMSSLRLFRRGPYKRWISEVTDVNLPKTTNGVGLEVVMRILKTLTIAMALKITMFPPYLCKIKMKRDTTRWCSMIKSWTFNHQLRNHIFIFDLISHMEISYMKSQFYWTSRFTYEDFIYAVEISYMI